MAWSRLFMVITLIYLFTGCSTSDDEPPVSQSTTSGPISGQVRLFDANGNSLDSDGMRIRIGGTLFDEFSDTNGRFDFRNIPFDLLNIEFSKEGFGTFYLEVDHDKTVSEGGTVLETLNLGEFSQTITFNETVERSGDDILVTLSTLPVGNATNPVYASVFLSKNDLVSNDNNYAVKGPIPFQAGQTQNQVRITSSELRELGFNEGESVYLRIYGDSFYSNAYPGLTGMIHPNVSTSESPVFTITFD